MMIKMTSMIARTLMLIWFPWRFSSQFRLKFCLRSRPVINWGICLNLSWAFRSNFDSKAYSNNPMISWLACFCRSTSAEARKLVKWKVEETFSWLRTTAGAPYDALQERMAHLKDTCQSHVHDAAKQSVEGICRKVSALSKQYAQNVHTAHLKLFVDPKAVKSECEPVFSFKLWV